jgi:hypothetical protein
MKAVWFKTNDTRITTEAIGTEEELMGWLESNNIAIIEKTHKYDSFGCGYEDMRLSIPCKGMDYDRAATIKSAITKTLANLGCEHRNIENLLDSFNFKKEFIEYECEDRNIVVDYIHVCISTRDDFGCPDNRFSLANLLNNHIWAIFNEAYSFYQR